MITLRAALITVLFFIIAVGTRCSCCKCEEVKTSYQYRFTDLNLSHLDHSGNDTVRAVENRVNKKAYAMRVDLGAVSAKDLVRKCSFPALFITEAQAFSCRCPMADYRPLHKVRSIRILDTDEKDVIDAFRFYTGFNNLSTDKRYIAVEQFISGFFPAPAGSYLFPAGDRLISSFVLFLMEPPADAGTYRFKMIVAFDDNTIIEQTSVPVTLE